MKEITKFSKTKEKKLYMLNSSSELSSIDFQNIIPEYAKQIEITYSDSNKILKVDYITNLDVKKYEDKE